MNPRGNGINELMGFVVFEPGLQYREDKIGIKIGKTVSKLTMTAINVLGQPECIVVFFDHMKRRMMIRPATSDMKNSIPLIKVPKSKSDMKRYIQSISLINQIGTIIGKDVRESGALISGHIADATEPALIFHLDDLQEQKP